MTSKKPSVEETDSSIERAIGQLQGEIKGMHNDLLEIKKDLKEHIGEETHIHKAIRAIREDVLIGKVQRRMALFIVGAASGLASALVTLKATIGKFWP